MAGLFADSSPQNLEDVLKQQAQAATAQTQDTYNQARKRLVAQQAHSGRLMSGVSDYPLGDLSTEQGQAESGIQTGLANALAGIPEESYLNQADFQRKLDLTKYIGSLVKPDTLQEVLGGLGTGLQIAGTVAAFG